MPWKNKQGTTLEIIISPASSLVDQLNFDYRLSSAPIVADSTFSNFPGYERLLLPIRGEGFSLNGHPYELFEVAQFSGDQKTECVLLKNEVLDLGLIFNPQKVSAQARTMHLNGNFQFSISPNQTHLVYVIQGVVLLNSQKAERGETVCVEDSKIMQFETKGRASVVLFKITRF